MGDGGFDRRFDNKKKRSGVTRSVRIGTSGYSYKDWVGPVYPAATPSSEFFSNYVTFFNFTELNFSYYRQPSAELCSRLVERAPDGFLFSIKGHKSMTHDRLDDWPEQVTIFKRGIVPLVETEKLAAVLLQFPFSFGYTPENRKYLYNLCSELSPLPTVLEFRNDRWQQESVYDTMRDLNVGYTILDMPSLDGLPRPDPVVTSPIGYLRFHGRNVENWWSGTNTSRYDYLYEEKQLEEWIPTITEVMTKVTRLFIAFNNHYKGKAVNNARKLKSMLDDVLTST